MTGLNKHGFAFLLGVSFVGGTLSIAGLSEAGSVGRIAIMFAAYAIGRLALWMVGAEGGAS